MALSDAVDDHPAPGGEGHPLGTGGNAPSNSGAQDGSCPEPHAAASNGDDLSAEAHEETSLRNATRRQPQKKPRSHVQRTNRPSQNGGVVKQNGSLRTIPRPTAAAAPAAPAAAPSPAATDSLTKRQLSSAPSPPSPPCLQPAAPCCQQCHFHSFCCPCGQQECPPLQIAGTGHGPGLAPHSRTPLTCSCCPPACTYSHPRPHLTHPTTPRRLHHHSHQPWQEHLQSSTHPTGIR